MGLKEQLSKIALEKEEKKKQLKKIKNRYITIIYAGLSNKKSVKQIHQELYNATINKKSLLLRDAMILTSKIKKKVENKKDTKYLSSAYGIIDPSILLAMSVFDEIKKNDVEQELNKEITKEVDNKESDGKLEALENAMASSNVFYLASKHNDSAKDHAPYQGLMYYNDNWMSEIDNEIARKEIADYITKNKIRTVQWVTGKPVWFITRPNCRHYFREIPVREVLQTSVNTLLKRYDMIRPIGKRTYVRTLESGQDRKIIGEMRNAELVIEKYKERLRLFESMYREKPNPAIKNAINKTKLLIQKWNEYLEKLKNNKK